MADQATTSLNSAIAQHLSRQTASGGAVGVNATAQVFAAQQALGASGLAALQAKAAAHTPPDFRGAHESLASSKWTKK